MVRIALTLKEVGSPTWERRIAHDTCIVDPFNDSTVKLLNTYIGYICVRKVSDSLGYVGPRHPV